MLNDRIGTVESRRYEMTTSTHSTRRLATLAVIAGLAATLAPLANAGYPRDFVADSVDTARVGSLDLFG